MQAANVNERVQISNALVVDGTGTRPYPGDILIQGGRIVAVAPLRTGGQGWSAREIEAHGRVVCPGFIDVHSHADNAPFLADDDLTKLSQGVTTEVTGNCGLALAPLDGVDRPAALDIARRFFPLPDIEWAGVPDLFAAIDQQGSVVNTCPLVGHGSLRTAVMGVVDRPASADDVAAMADLLREALDAGAFGLSSGLIYPPGVYSSTEELAALVEVLPAGRVYATHMRNESDLLLDSIDEALRTVRNARCGLQISHLKASGRQNFGRVRQALERLDQARDAGVPVTQDLYPYAAASTFLSACLPPWMHDGGPEQTLRRLRQPDDLQKARVEIEGPSDLPWENLIRGAGGYTGILVVTTGSGRYTGRTLLHLANELQLSPFDALVYVLVDEELDVQMVEFCMSEDDVETVLGSRSTAIGSDGLPPGLGGCPHPRLFGTFPRVLSHYVRDRHTIALSEAVRRMTGLPAQIFGIADRGVIATGYVADLVSFDPATIGHEGSYLNPAVRPHGIDWVMMAGNVVMVDGVWQDVRRGRRLQPA
jgi:N-acyl-D-amino-acid deacylase